VQYSSQAPLLGNDGVSGSPNRHSESLRVAQPGRYLPLGYASLPVPGDTTSLGSGYNRTPRAPQSSACFTCQSQTAATSSFYVTRPVNQMYSTLGSVGENCTFETVKQVFRNVLSLLLLPFTYTSTKPQVVKKLKERTTKLVK